MKKAIDKFHLCDIIIFDRVTRTMNIAGLCKGSTADSDSVCEGSNPSPAASFKRLQSLCLRSFFIFRQLQPFCRSKNIFYTVNGNHFLKRFYLKFYSRNYSQLFAWNKGCCFSAMPVPAFSDRVKQSVLCYNKCVKPMQKNADAKEVAYGTQCNFKARRVLR